MNFNPTVPATKLATWFMRRTIPSGVRRVAALNGAVASDIGSVRDENQDRVALVRGLDRSGGAFILAALADGIGGMKKGAECAAATLGTFIDSVVTDAQLSADPKDWLARGAQRANRAVHSQLGGHGGSTLVAALLAKGREPLWLSIGDSRVYQTNGGKLNQLSRDDTLEGQLGKPGGGHRPDLLQFVGIGDALEPHIEAVAGTGGTMLLTTDGVHFIDAEYLAKVVYYAPDLGSCARRLIELAKMLGGPDNASVAALSLDTPAVDVDLHLVDAFEVWDPFGELQVMFDRGARWFASTSQQPSPKVDAPSRISAPPAAPVELSVEKAAGHDAPTALQGAPNGRQHQKKPKASVKKGKKSPPEAYQQSEVDVPQLRIEFPNKTP